MKECICYEDHKQKRKDKLKLKPEILKSKGALYKIKPLKKTTVIFPHSLMESKHINKSELTK